MQKPKPMTEEEIKEAEEQMNPQIECEENKSRKTSQKD
jgi:hypothetical protein